MGDVVKKGSGKNFFPIFFLFLDIVLLFLVNVSGKLFARKFGLPVWLDCIGTIIAGCFYGPWCGGIIGIGLNISYGIFDHVTLLYAPVSFLTGFLAGVLYKKKYFDNIFNVFTLGMILSSISTFLAVPINILFYKGYCGNIFGDGIINYLLESKAPFLISCILGEITVDFVDKNLTCLIVFVFLKESEGHFILRFFKYICRNIKKLFKLSHVSVFILVFLFASVPSHAVSTDLLLDGYYISSVFSNKDGLIGGEANDIAFSKDGYLWVGTYSGLYQYDGNNFIRRYADKIKNVNCLFVDEESRLWIGTNDNGIAIRVGDSIANVIDTSKGLSSNSVKSISQDYNGNYYIGTSSYMNIVKISGGVKVTGTLKDSEYVVSVTICGDYVVTVINRGIVRVFKNNKVLYDIEAGGKDFIQSSACDLNGNLYLGTSGSKVLVCNLSDSGYSVKEKIDTKMLYCINSLTFDEDNRLWACCENGAGFYVNGVFTVLNTGTFSSSIDNMGVDYQKNIWFTSSRQGLMRICENQFANIYADVSGDTKCDVINCVIPWNGKYYYGSDDGLDVTDDKLNFITDDVLSNRLKGVRIRNLMVDSKNRLWICTYNGAGVLCVDKNYSITVYNTSSGTISNRFRSCIELSDGTIAVAENNGIDFIKDGSVIHTLSSKNGLDNAFILCLYENSDGVLYAGTDGGGIVEISNYKVVTVHKAGLSSQVVLRIAGDGKNGLYLVVGNGLNYFSYRGYIKHLDNFPFSNNFDIIPYSANDLMVLSSAGLFICHRDGLLSGEEVQYTLLSERDGLGGSITSNSFSYLEDEERLFLCCDNGCYLWKINYISSRETSYRLFVDNVMCDGEKFSVSRNFPIVVDGNTSDLVISPRLLNFTMNEPYVGFRLEGYEKKQNIVKGSDLSDIKYSNLPNGNYTFRLVLFSNDMKNVLEQVTYSVKKEMRIFDFFWFKLYFFAVWFLIVAWNTWFVAKKVTDRKLAIAEKNLRLTNETILAIAKTVDAKDKRTRDHSGRVGQYSYLIAKKLGWSEKECEDIRKMGLLHDIGKIGIPDNILNKPDRLTDDEYVIMKSHVEKGAEILKDFTIVKNVDMGAKYHHERYDGKGYPLGLAGDQIPVYARIIGIADAFDAMTANRVYRNKLDLNEVLSELKKSRGTQFDPELLDLFLSLLEDKTIDVEAIYAPKDK